MKQKICFNLLAFAIVSLPSTLWCDSGPTPSSTSQYALPGYSFSFPYDHGTHDEFRTEWWYFTGHLFTKNKQRFGFELIFFRRAVHDPEVVNHPSKWAIRHLYMAHFALSDGTTQQFRVAEKLSRAGLGKAGAKPRQLEVWIDDWRAEATTPDHNNIHLIASKEGFAVDLQLSLKKPPIVHGKQGVSRKGESLGQASHYYSLTRLNTQGLIRVDETQFEVTGLTWMDHEFGSGDLGDDQVGWDWFSLQLESSVEVMLYQLRLESGEFDSASSGTFIFENGQSRHLQQKEFQVVVQDHWVSPRSRARYPSGWTITIPSMELEVRVTPVFVDQELHTPKSTRVTYWEGEVDVDGFLGGAPVKGIGYVELTGYADPLAKAY